MKYEDMTYDTIKETIRCCARGLIVYASALAVKEMDDAVEDMRWLTNWITEFWLTDSDSDNWLEVREQYTDAFQQATLEAQQSGQAPPLTEQLQSDILNGLKIHIYELELIGEHDSFVEWCRKLCVEFPMAWENDCSHQCRRPDTGGLELRMP